MYPRLWVVILHNYVHLAISRVRAVTGYSNNSDIVVPCCNMETVPAIFVALYQIGTNCDEHINDSNIRFCTSKHQWSP